MKNTFINYPQKIMSSILDLKKNEFRNDKEFNTARDQITCIKVDKIIKEALEKGEKESIKKPKNNYIKNDLLEEVRTSVIKSYLESVKDKTIKEIKIELNKRIDEYIKNIQIILIKSNYEIEEYKKKYDMKEMECNDIKQKNNSLMRYNQELIKEINNYQSNLNSLHKSYEMLLKQKDLFEVILREYSSNTPDEILLELKLAKEGSLQLLENYNQIIKENNNIKEEMKKMKKKYDMKNESIINDFILYQEDKKNEEKLNMTKIRYLENKLYNNNKYQKDNYNLHQILYYIYNLLFEEFNLNKGVVQINKKYLDLKESDFNPNVMYDTEIRNYIELMAKSMHRETIDVVFRECVGYLNMIIRKYFPQKKNLRFKPVEMMAEIKNFIDSNIKLINDSKHLIEQYKNNYIKLEKENLKLNKKLEETNEKYNSYQLLIENQMQRDKRHLLQLKRNVNNRTCLSNSNEKNNNNTNNKTFNNYKANTIISKTLKDINNNDDNKNKISLFRIRKFKNEGNKKIEKRNIFKSNENKKVLPFSLSENKDESKKKEKDIILKTRKRERNKSCRVYKSKTIIKDTNSDKILKVHGKDKEIKFHRDFNFLIEETNRLFLYQPRMNSYNEKMYLTENKEDKGKAFIDKSDVKINNFLKIKNTKLNSHYYNRKSNNLEKHICGAINNLIKNFKK